MRSSTEPDACVEPEGMKVLADWVVQREREGHALEVVSPIHWDWKGEEPYKHFDQRYAPQWRDHHEPFEVPFIHAASWLMTLDTVRHVGGFNPAFFMYGEDNEWAHRMKKAGGSFVIHPDGALYHDEKPKPGPNRSSSNAWRSQRSHRIFDSQDLPLLDEVLENVPLRVRCTRTVGSTASQERCGRASARHCVAFGTTFKRGRPRERTLRAKPLLI